MGGGGGGSSLTPEELKRLQDLARERIREETQPIRRNVFISFSSDDLDTVNLLRGQSKNENLDLEFNDHSLKAPFDSENAEYIKRGIREKIRQSSVTLVYVSENTAGSKWVNWEIKESFRLGKGVVAVHSGEKPPSRLPSELTSRGISPVRWSSEALLAAIDEAAKKR